MSGAQHKLVSSLTWIDHDSNARERTLRILSLFNEKDSRDELGIGSIRDSLADRLFPGTSTIQTRLRYMLFVPWIYSSLEEKRLPAQEFAAQADRLERDLVDPLIKSIDQVGIFGKTAGRRLQRLPSSVYWSGLGAWGIRTTQFAQDEYHRRIEESYRRRDKFNAFEREAKSRGDDVDLVQRSEAFNWHPRLPKPPQDFPTTAEFALTKEEAEFLRDRIQFSAPDSLLSFLVTHNTPSDVNAPWEHPDYASFKPEHKELLTHARLFSEIMHGAALSYNLQLAQLKRNDELIAIHKEGIEQWIEKLPISEIRGWSLLRFGELTNYKGNTIAKPTIEFTEKWAKQICNNPKELFTSSEALNLIRFREIRLKRARSRFNNPKALEQWGGYSGVGRLVYRWPNVKTILNDLHQGMKEEK